MNTKKMGELAEAHVIAALLSIGKTVLLPFGDSERYDMVIDEDGVFLRIQVKTGVLKNGVIMFPTCNTVGAKSRVRKDYIGQIDFFAVYCDGNVYLIPIDDVSTGGASLRIDPPKNNQQIGIRYAKDYRIDSAGDETSLIRKNC